MATAAKPLLDEARSFTDPGIGYELRDAYSAWLRASQAELSHFEVTIAMWLLMRALLQTDGQTQKDLIEHAALMQSGTSSALNQLSRRGLIKTVGSSEDRRAIRYFLTPGGRSLLKKMTPAATRLRQGMVQGFSAREITTLESMLARIKLNCLNLNTEGQATRPRRTRRVTKPDGSAS